MSNTINNKEKDSITIDSAGDATANTETNADKNTSYNN